MQQALDAAWGYQFLTYPNPAVGAAVIDVHGKLLSVAAHQESGGPHAEVLAIMEALIALGESATRFDRHDAHALHRQLVDFGGDLFRRSTLVVTLEPCHHTGQTPPCSELIRRLGFKRVVIGMLDRHAKASGGAEALKAAGIEVVFGGMAAECEALVTPFLRWQNGRFIFFKLAQTLGGAIDGGLISCETSRRWVHRVRSRVDKLVIGGNTVRIDRPILDARLVGGRPPDVMIFSRSGGFDPQIPLFSVPGRSVETIGALDALPERGLIMIEGGRGMFQAVCDTIDWTVAFIAPSYRSGLGVDADFHGKIIHQRPSGSDAMLWIGKEPTDVG